MFRFGLASYPQSCMSLEIMHHPNVATSLLISPLRPVQNLITEGLFFKSPANATQQNSTNLILSDIHSRHGK